jgi:catechol 2,3-dioxygenase-like lactoylglutathione lyase family enzyme
LTPGEAQRRRNGEPGGNAMTEIAGFIKSSRRPGELGVHSLDHFHLQVPDLAVAENFYGEFGLDLSKKGNRLAVGTVGHPPIWGFVSEGARKKHSHLSFGAFEDDIDMFAKRLTSLGITRLDPPKDVDSNGLWFHDHDGNLVEILVAPKTSPDQKSQFAARSAGPGERGAPFRSTMKRTHPRRLAHVLMFTRDVRKAIEFYTSVLGLRLSDHSGDNIAFLHGIHGSDHHMVAFARSNAPGHHHYSWDVGSIDEIGAGAMHMLDKGFSKGWGLGRHVLGSNLFHYVQDPWGSFSEYSADIDFVPVDCDWQAGDHPPEDSFYAWGPNVPDDFVHNYEA